MHEREILLKFKDVQKRSGEIIETFGFLHDDLQGSALSLGEFSHVSCEEHLRLPLNRRYRRMHLVRGHRDKLRDSAIEFLFRRHEYLVNRCISPLYHTLDIFSENEIGRASCRERV